jgi:hypothetical protein
VVAERKLAAMAEAARVLRKRHAIAADAAA